MPTSCRTQSSTSISCNKYEYDTRSGASFEGGCGAAPPPQGKRNKERKKEKEKKEKKEKKKEGNYE